MTSGRSDGAGGGSPALATLADPGPGPLDRPRAKASLLDAVTDLRRDVAGTAFPLPLPGVEVAEGRRVQLLDQLDDHLLPRLRELSAPAVVVVAGSTGAGKSTLVNSLVGEEVSPAGILRPTTRRPVLVHHPDDAELLGGHPLQAVVDVVARAEVPRGLAMVDAPDLDSLLATNRSTAHRLLEAADLWLFVTTAARYGDALPWAVLDRATERGTSMAMVLNRVPSDALVTVRGDLMARLRARGMGGVPLFLVPDLGPHEGLLAPRTVAPIVRWLAMIAGPDRARSVIARTQRGSLTALRPWVDDLAAAVQAQVDARGALERVVADALVAPTEQLTAAVRAGDVVDGPVRSRWAAAEDGPLGRRPARRRRTARQAALADVADDLLRGVEAMLHEAAHVGRSAVRDALAATDVPGAAGVLAALDEAPGEAGEQGTGVSERQVATAWLTEAGRRLQEAGTADRSLARRVARMTRDDGREGAATVAAAAAGGLSAARDRLAAALGADAADRLSTGLREDLVQRGTAQVAAGAEVARRVLASPHLADDAASRLLLRRAVLKGVS